MQALTGTEEEWSPGHDGVVLEEAPAATLLAEEAPANCALAADAGEGKDEPRPKEELGPKVLPRPLDTSTSMLRPLSPTDLRCDVSVISPSSSKPSFGPGTPIRKPGMWPGAPPGSLNGESPSFNVSAVLARRNSAISWGICFHASDGKCLEILCIDEVDGSTKTPVGVYNGRVEISCRILPGRFIMSVNEACDLAGMEEEWVKGTVAKLQVCQPMEFMILLEKETGSKLGVDVHIDRLAGSIIILALGEGAIADWNTRRPELQVEVSDRIVAVNGERMRSDKLLEVLKDATGDVKVVIARPAWSMQVNTPSRRTRILRERARQQQLAAAGGGGPDAAAGEGVARAEDGMHGGAPLRREPRFGPLHQMLAL